MADDDRRLRDTVGRLAHPDPLDLQALAASRPVPLGARRAASALRRATTAYTSGVVHRTTWGAGRTPVMTSRRAWVMRPAHTRRVGQVGAGGALGTEDLLVGGEGEVDGEGVLDVAGPALAFLLARP